jgi:hypothetical protein
VLDTCWKRRITEHTYDRWKKDYGGAARGSRHAAEGARAKEFAPQADCCRPRARSVHLESGGLGKLLSPACRPEAVGHAVTVLQVSERRACRAIGRIRSSARYVPRPDHERARVRERIIALAKEYGWYGDRTVTDLVRREGWDVGKDSVYTIWWHEASTCRNRSRSEPDCGALMGRASGCGPPPAITSGRTTSWRIGRTTAGPFGSCICSTSTHPSVWRRSWPAGSAHTTCW